MGEGRPSFPKICETYPTIMKLGKVMPCVKQIEKIYESRDTPIDTLLTSSFLHWKSANFVISRNTDKDGILIHNL